MQLALYGHMQERIRKISKVSAVSAASETVRLQLSANPTVQRSALISGQAHCSVLAVIPTFGG